MKRLLAIALIAVVALVGLFYMRKHREELPGPPTASAPASVPPGIVGATLLDGLGNYHFAITAKPVVRPPQPPRAD